MHLHHRAHKTDACPGRRYGALLVHPPGEYLNQARMGHAWLGDQFPRVQDSTEALALGQTLWLRWQITGSLYQQYEHRRRQGTLELLR